MYHFVTYKRLVTLLLAGMVFTSTAGFNVHVLYCFCREEWKVSLFDVETKCDATAASKTSDDCCLSHSGCNRNLPVTAFQKPPCESTSVEFVKMDDKFTESTPKWDPQISFTAENLVHQPFSFPLYGDFLTYTQNKAPPTPYGRDLLSRIQILTC